MCEVEVELPVKRHPEGCQTEDEEVPGAGSCLLVGHEGDPLGGAAVDVERLPDGELEDTHQGVPHVVHHLPGVVAIQINAQLSYLDILGLYFTLYGIKETVISKGVLEQREGVLWMISDVDC